VTSPEAIVNLHATLDAARFFHRTFEFETHVLQDAQAGFHEGRARPLSGEIGRPEQPRQPDRWHDRLAGLRA